MYNGVGVPTARGTGTSGYVQTNKANAVRQPYKQAPKPIVPKEDVEDWSMKEREIRRSIENEVLEYSFSLEEKNLTEEELTDELDKFRAHLESKYLNIRHAPERRLRNGG